MSNTDIGIDVTNTAISYTGTAYDCEAGYYCVAKAITTTPTSSALGGNECPAGHYCEA